MFADETDACVAQELRQRPVPPLLAIKLSKHPKGHRSTLRLNQPQGRQTANADHMNALPLGTPCGGHRGPTSLPVVSGAVNCCLRDTKAALAGAGAVVNRFT